MCGHGCEGGHHEGHHYPPLPPPWFQPGAWPPSPHAFYIRGLLHLAVLKILKEEPLHGSEIQRVLREKFGFEVTGPAIYGTLRKLEVHGFVIATWDTTGSGPARRVYRITEEGVEYLKRATEKLMKLRELVEKLVS